MEDLQQLPSSADLGLDLSLYVNMNSDMRCHRDASTDVDHDQHQHNPRVFSCNYCQRKFYSSQALGGHQNAHKRERTMAKRHRIVSDAEIRRSSSMASIPLHGYRTFNHKSLGIQVHSMIHKPISSYVSSSIGNDYGSGYGHHGDGSKSGAYGREGWHRLPLHQHPNAGKLGGQGSAGGVANGNSVTGVAARFEGARKEGISECLWPGVGVANQLKSKPQELHTIDLSLRL